MRVADALAELMDLGVTGAALVAAIRRVEEATYAKHIAEEKAAEDKRAKRRAGDAERKRLARASAEIQRTNAESANVQRTPQPSGGQAADKDAPTHVGDIKPTSENNQITTPCFSAGAFEKPTKADLDALDAQLAGALGPAMASKATSPKLFDLSPILGLLRGGQGPPADLEADVLPTLRSVAARSSPGSIKTWAYFVPAIREARDRRLSGAPIIQLKPNERPDPSTKRQAREANYARAVAGAGVFAGD